MPITTFITRLEPGPDDGPVLAVKDIIDVAGVPTTAGSRAVADGVAPAEVDADCMRGARCRRARLIGKTNLFELAFGASGLNEHFGTPVNPLDRNAVPGGSSSGSAVAVATHEADVAYGSDTGGSIRIPSAFCGTAGLKTTFGRVPLGGVWPLAPASTRLARWPATSPVWYSGWSCSSRGSSSTSPLLAASLAYAYQGSTSTRSSTTPSIRR